MKGDIRRTLTRRYHKRGSLFQSMFHNINRPRHSLLHSILVAHSRAVPAVPDVEWVHYIHASPQFRRAGRLSFNSTDSGLDLSFTAFFSYRWSIPTLNAELYPLLAGFPKERDYSLLFSLLLDGEEQSDTVSGHRNLREGSFCFEAMKRVDLFFLSYWRSE